MIKMTPNEGLELLVQARETIADPWHEYFYGDWRDCACGHLYQAAMGRRARATRPVNNPGRNAYGQLMKLLDPVVPVPKDWPVSTYGPRSAGDVNLRLSMLVSGGRNKALRILDDLIEDYAKHYEITDMDIGEEVRTIQVEPAKQPVPEREAQPHRQIPSREPATPEREPEKVPAK